MEQPRDQFDKIFGDKSRVLVVLAHPDDNEVVCGGTVARLVAAGKAVRIVVATNGEKGTGDSNIDPSAIATLRLAEQIRAGQELGVPTEECFNLGIPDGELDASVKNIEKVVYHIREFRPDIVITHNPHQVINTFSSAEGVRWVNHRDHRHTGLITTDALYPYSRDTAFFPDQLAAGLKSHMVTEILYSDSHELPENVAVDVSDHIEQKRRALAACSSVIPAEHVNNYIDEIKIGDKYFEQLGYFNGLF